MKLELSESFPGELNGDADYILRKAQTALEAALEKAGITCCGLQKGQAYKTRGGEIHVIEDLAKGLGAAYEQRLEKMKKDLEGRLTNRKDLEARIEEATDG